MNQVSKEDIEDLICRFLINLPPQEKQFPRLFFNINEACYFYYDNNSSMPVNGIDNNWKKKFAQRVFQVWPYLANNQDLNFN